MQEYHKVADEHMDHLLDSLQRIVDDSEGAEDWDVDYNVSIGPSMRLQYDDGRISRAEY